MIYPEPKTLTLTLPDWDPFLAELGVPLPWALIPIADQPLLAHWLDCALDIGYERVRIIGRDPTRAVEQFLAEATLWPLELVFLREVEVSAKSTDYRKLTTLPRASTVTPSVDSAWDLICLRQSLEQERLEALSPEDCIGAHGTIDPSVTLSGPY